MLSFLVPRRVRRNLLPASQLHALNQAVLDSPYLGTTDLDQGFEQTCGFSMVFRRQHLDRVYRVLPGAQPYLEKILEPRSQAFLLNPLVIHQGHGVAPHADKTLLSFFPTHHKTPFPYRVSVLYLSLPQDLEGGELVFHRNALVKARFRPEVNALVEFPGWLYHEVKPWSQVGEGASSPRVSLVCEQYRLSEKQLAHVPEFHLESTRGFGEFLEQAERGLE